jgi:hypothetical protein
MGLSKSRYTTFCQCPKALWLKTYRPELEVIPEALQSRFATCQEIGTVARELFAPYINVDTRKPDGFADIDEMIHKTALAMDDIAVDTICEAAFAFDGNYCAVDILHRSLTGWEIYEVKSSSVNPGIQKSIDEAVAEYLNDVSYQVWLLRQRDINVTGAYIVLLNSQYILDGELDINHLFYKIPVIDQMTKDAMYEVGERVKEAEEAISDDANEYIEDLGPYCKKPHDCAFIDYCIKQRGIEYPSVFNLYRAQWKKKLEYLNEGYKTFEDCKPLLGTKIKTKTQTMQVTCTLENRNHIDPIGIKAFLEKLRYPLYYLDFETMQPAIPIYQGTHPYQQVPFQYSLHIQDEPLGSLMHTEYLGYPNEDPRRALAEKLCRDIPDDVCVIAYNKQFECGRIEELANMYPDLSEHLLLIREHIVDLLAPFQDGYYYTPAMKDSFSIKSVLPALFPNSDELNYHNLNESVQNGADAMTIFPKMAMMNEAEVKNARESLLAYCCLDTLAMVRVLEKLYEVIK